MGEFSYILENTSNEDVTVDVLNKTSEVGQVTPQYELVTPYQSSPYPTNTYFRVKFSGQNAEITIDVEKTSEQMVDVFNSFDIGTFSLYANNGIDGTVYRVFSKSIIEELEVVLGIPAPVLLTAVTNIAGTQIELTFDKSMSDPSGKENEFSYNIDAVPEVFTSAAIKPSNDKIIVLTCNTVIESGETIIVNYTEGSVQSIDQGILNSFSNETVTNNSSNVVLNFGNGLPTGISTNQATHVDGIGDTGQPISIITATTIDPKILYSRTSISDSLVRYIKIRFKWVSGIWQGLFWIAPPNFGGGGVSMGPSPTLGQWTTITLDINDDTTHSGSSTTGFRLDFTGSIGSVIHIDYIAMGSTP